MNTDMSKSNKVPFRLLLATVVLALASGFTLTAVAAPGAHGPADGGHGMPMMGGPRDMARLLDGVGASAEQRAQIKAIVDAAAPEQKAQRETSRALHEQALQLFTQPTVDARAAEALRQQMLAQHDQASKRQMQIMLDVSRVLTPEQRRQFAEHSEKSRAMMERHRAERDRLDAPAR
jgi:periplasmic protein CpxP/Spy